MKLIIFSDFRSIFNKISDIIDELDLKWMQMDGGSIDAINDTIEAYKEGPIQILMIESSLYASGMNLENTTDMILIHNSINSIQIIGRANRPGRVGPLKIHHLLYKNETE